MRYTSRHSRQYQHRNATLAFIAKVCHCEKIGACGEHFMWTHANRGTKNRFLFWFPFVFQSCRFFVKVVRIGEKKMREKQKRNEIVQIPFGIRMQKKCVSWNSVFASVHKYVSNVAKLLKFEWIGFHECYLELNYCRSNKNTKCFHSPLTVLLNRVCKQERK